MQAKSSCRRKFFFENLHNSKKSSTFAVSNDSEVQNNGWIEVTGARVHNLKNVDVRIPRGRLTVFTGLSGSGKSSLAFDTIFAEGQRRYIDTFSAYARGYLNNMQRPDVDKITGLSPVISIDQKTTSHNPRSTVGTITEVYDYLRLLYARAAIAYSYNTGEPMVHYTDEQIVDIILREYAGERVYILAPLVNNRKGHYKELFEQTRKKGFVYVRIDGQIQELVQGLRVDRYKNHTIEVVVDRVKVTADGLQVTDEAERKRILESVAHAMQLGNGLCIVLRKDDDKPHYFSRSLMCPTTGIAYADPAPHSFSFNTPQGWCPCCRGLGIVRTQARTDGEEDLPDEESVIAWLEGKIADPNKPAEGDETHEPREEFQTCPECQGQRLRKESLMFRIGVKNIAELAMMDLTELRQYLREVKLNERQQRIAEEIIKEIDKRLAFMEAVGLQYLNLNRPSDSLSGGEAQRIRLATQIGSRLVNVLYILDEPSIGLHQRDNGRLIRSLKELRDLGNTIIVVEHDEQMMRSADWIVDIGPKAGRLGGKVLFEGEPEAMLQTDTLTADYLNGKRKMPGSQKRAGNGDTLVLTGCRGNNLRSITAEFPLGTFIVVTGVSGSGKSTLINKTLYPILSQRFYRSLRQPMAYDRCFVRTNNGYGFFPREAQTIGEAVSRITGYTEIDVNERAFQVCIDKVVAVDQSPIGRTPRSNPATYTGVFSDIRALFAELPESKIRGWKQGRFSFNTKGGRCDECSGNGYKTIEMRFLPDVLVPCEVCGGQRYNRETLEARFKGKNIAEVLDMTINQAVEFFDAQPHILNKIKTLQEVGLGYLKLGQSATTLSGGEAQRVKLATELARPSTGKTLFILDEPTTGLHFEDTRVLLGVLQKLVDKGNTVLVIEHNLDIINAADHIIDLGPEGGRDGGQIVATGTQKQVKRSKLSRTSPFL